MIDAEPREYLHPRISPDGESVALGVFGEETDIWILDLSVGNASRLTFAAEEDVGPVWTPDGERILFGSGRGGSKAIYSKAASGAGSVDRLTEGHEGRQFPNSISPDGARLVYRQEGGTDGSMDIFVRSLEGQSSPEPLLATEFQERSGEISPNGRWLAYTSNESGTSQVYVRPFPNVADGLWQVSSGSTGLTPLWSRDGQELFYRTAGRELWVAPVATEGEDFEHATPEFLFGGRFFGGTQARTYDVSASGERFLMIKASATAEEGSRTDVVMVENWFEELN